MEYEGIAGLMGLPFTVSVKGLWEGRLRVHGRTWSVCREGGLWIAVYVAVKWSCERGLGLVWGGNWG